ncbi:hypothetical protein QUF64_09040 [Anaerolineales bacterium HSG6]|nr:hypothetical protein [Anaerolineales bacterium HSG6]
MGFEVLGMWADEEQKIQSCLVESLRLLIAQKTIKTTDQEKYISGKLRPFLTRVCKRQELNWSLHAETSTFEQEDDAEAEGHPDIQFSRRAPDYNQYDYHVECKLVRLKESKSDTDYCYKYVSNGILRYQTRKYAQTFSPLLPPMGTMLGYVQAGDLPELLKTINEKIEYQQKKRFPQLQKITEPNLFHAGDVSRLQQGIQRNTANFVLHHLWADFR